MATAELTKEDLVALFRRVVPSAYAEGMLSGPGAALIEALAAQFARLSSAVARSLDQQAHILTASAGQKADGGVTFTRSITGSTATISKGTRLRSRSGLQFVTTGDALFGASDASVTTTASATDPSFAGNVLPGEIDTVLTLVAPVLGVLGTVTVTNAFDFAGGKSPVLVMHASNRGLHQQANETEDAFRARIRRLLDTVTLPAVQEAGNRVLRPAGKQGFISEPFDLSSTDGPQVTVLDSDYLDDFPGSAVYHQELLLGDGQARGSFFFHVPFFQTSVPQAFLDGAGFFDGPTFFDQDDLVVRGWYKALMRAVEDAKAGGVNVVFVLDANL